MNTQEKIMSKAYILCKKSRMTKRKRNQEFSPFFLLTVHTDVSLVE